MDPQRHFEVKARELAEQVDCGNAKRAAADLLFDFDANPQEAIALIRAERAREQGRRSRVHLDVDPDGQLVFRNGNNGVYAGRVDPRLFANTYPQERPMPPGPLQQLSPGDAGAWNNPGAMPPEALYQGGGNFAQGGWNPGYPLQQPPPPPWQYSPPQVAPPFFDPAEGLAIAAGTALGVLAIGLGSRGQNRYQMPPRYRWNHHR